MRSGSAVPAPTTEGASLSASILGDEEAGANALSGLANVDPANEAIDPSKSTRTSSRLGSDNNDSLKLRTDGRRLSGVAALTIAPSVPPRVGKCFKSDGSRTPLEPVLFMSLTSRPVTRILFEVSILTFRVQAQLAEAQHYASAEALLYTSACWRFAQREICHTCKLGI